MIKLRSHKGSELSHEEMDQNLSTLWDAAAQAKSLAESRAPGGAGPGGSLTAADVIGLGTAATRDAAEFATASQLAEIIALLAKVNLKPTVPGATASIFDVGPSTTVNLLGGAVDPNGDPLTVIGASFQGIQKSVGVSFETTYGTVLVQSSGYMTYSPNSAAWALKAGQNVNDVIGYVVSDGQGAAVASTVSITVIGQNNAPVAIADTGRAPFNKPTTGNVLSNDYAPDQGPIELTQFVVFGDATIYTPGQTATIGGVGTLTMQATGSWTFNPQTGYSGTLPPVTYTVASGGLTSTGTLTVAVSPAPADVLADPVTAPLTGASVTYHVYSDADGNAVPWGALPAGAVVNIYWKATPYRFKFGLRARGTIGSPVVINGVTDASGTRPRFDWTTGAFTAAGSNPSGGFSGANDVFSNVPAYGESLGGIAIKHGVGDDYEGYVPCWIQIKNLDLRGGLGSYTALDGNVTSWSGNGIWVLRSSDCLVENCLVTDCFNGIFTQAKDGTLPHTSVRFTIRNCRLWGNGVVNSFYEHNVYNQGYGAITEGCYLGQLRPSATGSSYKSRQGAEIFRYNWVEANARAVDFVHSEDNELGIPLQPDYATTWCYGNVFITDQGLPNGASVNPIHFGGDNLGEQETGTTVVVPSQPYRNQLYFWNNTFYARIDTSSGYRASIFNLSLVGTRCDAWNNIFVLSGTTAFSWLRYAGQLNLRGTNLVFGTVTDAGDTALPSNYDVNKLGTIITGDPFLVDAANYDLFLTFSSAAIDAGGAAPSGLPHSGIDDQFPVEYQPRKRSNGYVARPQGGVAIDCGATEYGVGYTPPPPPAPANLTLPTISGSAVEGSQLTAQPGSWLGRPTFTYQWLRNGVDIPEATQSTFTTGASDFHTNISVRVSGTNATPPASSATSDAVYIISQNAPMNSDLPTVSGTAIEGNTLSTTPGVWSGSPSSYSYQWLRDGVAIAGATSPTYTLVFEDVGHLVGPKVFATNAFDTNSVVATPVSVAAAPADPDPSGTYNFTSADGTKIATLNGGAWMGFGPSSTQRYECVSGALQCVAGTGSNGESCYTASGVPSTGQAAEIRILPDWTGSTTLYIHQTDIQSGYQLLVTPSTWTFRRGGIWQNSGSNTVPTTGELILRLVAGSGVVTAYINGVQVYQFTEATPITGGGLAFTLLPGSDVSKLRMDYFKTT